MNTPEKRRIATKAYQMLRDSEAGSIVLDAGSTIGNFADHIGAENFSLKTGNDRIVITHALHIAVKLAEAEGVTLELVGGQLRKMTWVLLGTRRRALRHHASRYCFFIGANGIEAHFGISTPRDERSHRQDRTCRRPAALPSLCDSAKFGQNPWSASPDLRILTTLLPIASPKGALRQAPRGRKR